MAVPGRITDTRSEGTNHLIKTNVAQLVTSAVDIAKALGWEVADAMPEKMHFAPHEITPKERSVYNAIADSADGLTLDKVAEQTALSVSEVSAILLNMELSGMVRQLPGKVYVIC
jgi:DNA processing protein